MPIDIPPQVYERVTCSISAAAKYQIPANIVLAVAEKENGKPGQWVRNNNGTHDVGTLQFNTAYLRELARYGIVPADVAAAGCYPYELAAWRLRKHIAKDQGDLWTRAANYHSRTPRFNDAYRADLMERAARWADWLAARYPTHEISAVRAGTSGQVASSGGASGILQSLDQRRPAEQENWKAAAYVPRKLLVHGQP